MRRFVSICGLVAGLAMGADKQQPDKLPAPTEVQLKNYWRLRAMSAQVELQLSSLYLEMQKTCGEKHGLTINPQTGEPVCVPRDGGISGSPIQR